MKRLALFLLLALSSVAPGQTPVIRFTVMDDYVREYLGKEWDAHLNDKPMLERGYCLAFQLDEWADEVAYRVTQIAPADSQEATVNSINFQCPKQANVVELHVHPPQTCVDAQRVCWQGGAYAWQCLASDTDHAYIERVGQPFGMVQCSREGIVTFWPRVKRAEAPKRKRKP